MIYDVHHSNMIHAANQNTAVVSKQYQDNQAALKSKNQQKNNGFSSLDIRKFTQKLNSISLSRSTAKCARYVRIALQSAGAKIVNHPVAAADWGATLKTIGYRQIQPSFEKPVEGDIYIIHRTQKHVYGHIAAYTGQQWVSDFRQKSHAVYKGDRVTYSYYRMV